MYGYVQCQLSLFLAELTGHVSENTKIIRQQAFSPHLRRTCKEQTAGVQLVATRMIATIFHRVSTIAASSHLWPTRDLRQSRTDWSARPYVQHGIIANADAPATRTPTSESCRSKMNPQLIQDKWQIHAQRANFLRR